MRGHLLVEVERLTRKEIIVVPTLELIALHACGSFLRFPVLADKRGLKLQGFGVTCQFLTIAKEAQIVGITSVIELAAVIIVLDF